jgi:hypothetical protein
MHKKLYSRIKLVYTYKTLKLTIFFRLAITCVYALKYFFYVFDHIKRIITGSVVFDNVPFSIY